MVPLVLRRLEWVVELGVRESFRGNPGRCRDSMRLERRFLCDCLRLVLRFSGVEGEIELLACLGLECEIDGLVNAGVWSKKSG